MIFQPNFDYWVCPSVTYNGFYSIQMNSSQSKKRSGKNHLFQDLVLTSPKGSAPVICASTAMQINLNQSVDKSNKTPQPTKAMYVSVGGNPFGKRMQI